MLLRIAVILRIYTMTERGMSGIQLQKNRAGNQEHRPTLKFTANQP